MQVYFLGTGTSQGIPVIGCDCPVCVSTDLKNNRLRVSVSVTWNNKSIVIDCGPDFRQQMVTSKCDKVDAILFTHEHSDHTAGIDDIRPYNFMSGKPMPIYGSERVLENLRNRFGYIFETKNRYPGAPSVQTFEVKNNTIFEIGETTITPINADHGGLPVFGYRIRDFVYLTDVKSIEKEELNKLKDVKVLVINALREESHNSHFNLQEALDFIHLVQPEKAFLTHISHHLGLHEVVQNSLPENVFLAYDNLSIEI